MLEFWFSPYGRAARADYWYWLVLPGLAGAASIILIGPIVFGRDGASFLLLVGFVLFCVSHMALAVKRLHDQSLSGWYSTALILPFFAAAGAIGSPDAVDLAALDRASEHVRLVLLAVFAVVFAPFAFVLGLIWFGAGKDGVNRYGHDPLYR
jgi:uncharacterized membrane protein YhaH (DUF805 family)